MTFLESAIADNPIITKHARARLRRSLLLAPLGLVLTVCITAVWGGTVLNWHVRGWTIAGLLLLQVLLVVLLASQQISSAIGGARASGILDYHRISPQPPWSIALGFFLGAPLREYVLFAVTVPFLLACSFLGNIGLSGGAMLSFATLLVGWFIQALFMLLALVAKKPKGSTQGSAGGLAFLGLFVGWPAIAGLTQVRRLFGAETSRFWFYDLEPHWLVGLALIVLPILGFLLAGCFRKMRSDRSHSYRKATAVAFLASFGFLLLGVLWRYRAESGVLLGLLYPMVVFAFTLTATVTPGRFEYLKGVRQALAQGKRRASPWTDWAANTWAILAYTVVVLIAASLGSQTLGSASTAASRNIALSIVVCMFTIAYVGFAHQYFNLRVGEKSSANLLGAVLMLLWLAPLVGGLLWLWARSAAGPVSADQQTAPLAVMALSPVAGIALSAGAGPQEIPDIVRYAAVVTPSICSFLFLYLTIGIQRRFDRALKSEATSRPASESKAEPLLAG